MPPIVVRTNLFRLDVGRSPPVESQMTTARFYDDLATYYYLIFQDWESSMSRQGAAIDRLIRRELGSEIQPPDITLVDASAGIGTQALPLALKGYRVTARDISPDAIARLQREAGQRGLDIPSAVADMRALYRAVSEPFHVVLSFDNSLRTSSPTPTCSLRFARFCPFCGREESCSVPCGTTSASIALKRARIRTAPGRAAASSTGSARIGRGATLRTTMRRWSSRRNGRTTGGRSCGRR